MPQPTSMPCADEDALCGQWARVGECSANQQFMHVACRQSCGLCTEDKEDAAPSDTPVDTPGGPFFSNRNMEKYAFQVARQAVQLDETWEDTWSWVNLGCDRRGGTRGCYAWEGRGCCSNRTSTRSQHVLFLAYISPINLVCRRPLWGTGVDGKPSRHAINPKAVLFDRHEYVRHVIQNPEFDM